MAWDKTLIAEGVLAPDMNDEIRANWSALEAALTKEMNFSTGGTASLQGIMKQGSARMFSQATAPATRIDGSAFASTDLGLLWIDTDNNKIYSLTATTPTWTLISTEIIALLVSQINTWALAQTFSVSPVFTKGIVANDTYIQGRNNADDGNIDIAKVNTSDGITMGAVTTLPDTSALATSGAPAADAQVANKKYVDDQNTADHPAYTGGESHTDGSGMILKQGTTNRSGNDTTITFATPFPNECTRVFCGNRDSSSAVTGATAVNTVTVNGFVAHNNTAGLDGYDWIAIGY